MTDLTRDETDIRTIIERWAQAVRDEDLTGIAAAHAPDMLMFDVPPPFEIRGLEAYAETWPSFFSMQARPVTFDISDLAITAGSDVAFATAKGQCRDLSSGEAVLLDFRLTVGLRKHEGQWLIAHEHHSIPATDG